MHDLRRHVTARRVARLHQSALRLPFHKNTPPLYQSGVVFQAEEPFTTNYFRDIPRTLQLGYGHCVALAAWRIAELREKGERVSYRIDAYPDQADGRTLVHIFLKRQNGDDEDPARRLGMT